MTFYNPPVEIFTAAYIQDKEGNVRFLRAMFTKNNVKRRDNLHVGSRVGVDDARVHLPAQSTKNCPKIDGTPRNS